MTAKLLIFQIKKIYHYIFPNIDFLNINFQMNCIKLRKNKQEYLKKIKTINPKIFSGRKNLNKNYNRVLKNILLTMIFMKIKNPSKFIDKKIEFKNNKNYIFAYFK